MTNVDSSINHLITEYNLKASRLSKGFFLKEGRRYANYIKKNILEKKNFYVFKLNKKNQYNIEKNIILFSSLFGKHIYQNYKKEKYIDVSPNYKLIKKYKKKQNEKLRYHQTNKGGSIHTDGPQLLNPPKTVFLGCVNNNVLGGFSILVDGKKLYNHIKKKNIKLLKRLEKKFLFERRGFKFKNRNILQKPIFEIKKNFKVRYLSEYVTTAYKKLNKKLTHEQFLSLKMLDNSMANKKLQKKIKLNRGDILIINNHTTLHGRTAFKLNSYNSRKLKRIWSK